MQKIIILPSESDVLQYFLPSPDFKINIPYLPDDIILSGDSQKEDTLWLHYMCRKVIPALLFFYDGKILAVKETKNYRIWFGEPITQEDIVLYPDSVSLIQRTIKKERVKRDIPITFIGYITARGNRQWDAFLIVYAAKLQTKQLLKNESFIEPNLNPNIYMHLDPLSKKIFDIFYETPELHKKYLSV
jgi:hypothetical protein